MFDLSLFYHVTGVECKERIDLMVDFVDLYLNAILSDDSSLFETDG